MIVTSSPSSESGLKYTKFDVTIALASGSQSRESRSFAGSPNFVALARPTFFTNDAYATSEVGTFINDRIVTRGAFVAPRSRNRASIWVAITFISGSFGGKKFAWEVRLRYGTLPRCVYCTPAHENLLISVFCLVAISSAFSHPFA